MIGTTISHYKILQKLGEGGMGVVYKAHDTKLQRDVALKFLPHYLTSDPTEKERFYHEARAAAALTNPNIAVVYEIGEHDQQIFIAMEYVEGQTLKDIVGAMHVEDPALGGKLPLPIYKILDIAIQICEGLATAHEKKIIHRDIKSANIMLTPKGQVKIMDFGLAKVLGATKLTKTGSTLGTAAYMSPEQAQSEEVDQRSDIFSFGVVLYELLTTKLPFRGEHHAALMYSIVNENPQPIARFNEKVTQEIERIVSKTLAKDKEDRYQHVDDLIADLRRERKNIEYARAGYATTSGSALSSGSIFTGRKRRKLFSMAALGGTGIIILVVAYLVFYQKRAIEINPDMIIRLVQIPIADLDYPRISGDGNWIVFPAVDRSGKSGFYIMHSMGGEPRFIAPIQGKRSCDLSPDGSLIVWSVWDRQSGECYVYKVPTNGGTPLKILQGWAPRFRPDGRRIGYIRGLGVAAPSPSGKIELWSAGIDGSDQRREFIDSFHVGGGGRGYYVFSYSPSGKKVAWIREYPELYSEIVIYDLEKDREKIITSDKKNLQDLVWTAGDQIVYTSDRRGVFNIWMVPATGGIPVQIKKETTPISSVSSSADGRKLLYHQLKSPSDFWIVNIPEDRANQITFREENQYSPKFSPDGKKIAFLVGGPANFYPGDAYSESHLYVMDRDGNNRRQLTFGDEVVWSLQWSTDGRRIAYGSRKVAEPADSFRTYVVELSNPGSPKYIALGTPGAWLDSVRFQLLVNDVNYVTSIYGVQPTRVYDDSTLAYYIQRGRYIIYYDFHIGKDPKQLWIVDGTKPREVQRKTARLLPFTSLFKGDSKNAYWLKEAGDIWKMTLPNGKLERIQANFLGVEYFNDFNPSQDGGEMIIVKRRYSANVVMIENLFK